MVKKNNTNRPDSKENKPVAPSNLKEGEITKPSFLSGKKIDVDAIIDKEEEQAKVKLAAQQEPSEKNNMPIIIGAITGVVAVAGAGGFYMFSTKEDSEMTPPSFDEEEEKEEQEEVVIEENDEDEALSMEELQEDDDLVAVKDEEGNFIFVDKDDPLVASKKKNDASDSSKSKPRDDFSHLDDVIADATGKEKNNGKTRKTNKLPFERDKDGDLVFEKEGDNQIAQLPKPKPSLPNENKPPVLVGESEGEKEDSNGDIASNTGENSGSGTGENQSNIGNHAPSKPNEPPVPEKPKPLDPSKPLDPTKPPIERPNKPKPPMKPIDPSRPVEPTTPEKPTVPEEPTEKPSEPTRPEQPDHPEKPTVPEQPNEPEQPKEPEQPTNKDPFDNPKRNAAEVVLSNRQMTNASKMLNLINEYRMNHNQTPLRLSHEMMYATYKKADYMYEKNTTDATYRDSKGEVWSNNKLASTLNVNVEGTIRESVGEGNVESIFANWMTNNRVISHILSANAEDVAFSNMGEHFVMWTASNVETVKNRDSLRKEYDALVRGFNGLHREIYTTGSYRAAQEYMDKANIESRKETIAGFEEAIRLVQLANNQLINIEIGYLQEKGEDRLSVTYAKVEKAVQAHQTHYKNGFYYEPTEYQRLMKEWNILKSQYSDPNVNAKTFREQLVRVDSLASDLKFDASVSEAKRDFYEKKASIETEIQRIGKENFHPASINRLVNVMNRDYGKVQTSNNVKEIKDMHTNMSNLWDLAKPLVISEYREIIKNYQQRIEKGEKFTSVTNQKYNLQLQNIQAIVNKPSMTKEEYEASLQLFKNAYNSLVLDVENSIENLTVLREQHERLVNEVKGMLANGNYLPADRSEAEKILTASQEKAKQGDAKTIENEIEVVKQLKESYANKEQPNEPEVNAPKEQRNEQEVNAPKEQRNEQEVNAPKEQPNEPKGNAPKEQRNEQEVVSELQAVQAQKATTDTAEEEKTTNTEQKAETERLEAIRILNQAKQDAEIVFGCDLYTEESIAKTRQLIQPYLTAHTIEEANRNKQMIENILEKNIQEI